MGYIQSARIEGNKFIVVPGATTLWAEDAYSVFADGVRIYEHLTSANLTLNNFTIPPGTKVMCAIGHLGSPSGAALRYGETNRICVNVSVIETGTGGTETGTGTGAGTGTGNGNGGIGGMLLLLGIAAAMIYLIGGKK